MAGVARFVLIAVMVLAVRRIQAETLYRVDLVPKVGDTIAGYAIGDGGHVTGYSYDSTTQTSHAFVWDGNQTTLVPVLLRSMGRAINSRGTVVGEAVNGTVLNAFSYKDGQVTLLDSYAEASDVNALDHIVGYTCHLRTSQNVQYCGAFFTDGSTMEILETPEGFADARALSLNDHDQVVGRYRGSWTDGYRHAFLWDRTTGAFTDLGTFGQYLEHQGGLKYPEDLVINNRGQILARVDIGASSVDTSVFWDPRSGGVEIPALVPDITSVHGFAIGYDLNDHSHVVGYSYTSAEAGRSPHAIVWDSAQGTIDLNGLIPANSGWELSAAYGINNRGQIVGTGWYNGNYETFVLTPVPEPSSNWLGALGLLCMAAVIIGRRVVSW